LETLADLGATIRHDGSRAFYSIATDAVQMPAFEGCATYK